MNDLPSFAAIAVVEEVAAVTRRIRLRMVIALVDKKEQKQTKINMDSKLSDRWFNQTHCLLEYRKVLDNIISKNVFSIVMH